MTTKTILGVKIDDLSLSQAIDLVSSWPKAKHYIVTPNPEFIMSAQKDPEFKEILNKADLSIPDGVGLKLGGVQNTIAGVDFLEALCSLAATNGWGVGFFGGREGVAKTAADNLKIKFPSLKVTFVQEGGEILSSGVTTFEVSKLPESDIVFVGLGHIKQEKWIVAHLNQIHATIFMGVGGSFDYLSGKVPRAPLILRQLGLEWLFRLIIQPWRIKRQLALLEYTYKVLLSRFGF